MISHITLATRDVSRSVAFFRESLAAHNPAGQYRRHGCLAGNRAGMELHLIEDQAFEPSPFEKEFGRHIAVSFPLGEFSGLKERLQARGAALIEPLRATPFQRFFFRDPNGYVFEVVEENHDEPRPVE